MVKTQKNGVVAEPVETVVSQETVEPVFDVDARDEWDLPSSMVKSLVPNAPYEWAVMKSNYDLDASFETDDMDDFERTLLAMQGWSTSSVATLRYKRETDDQWVVTFQGLIASRQGEKTRISWVEKVQSGPNALPLETPVIILFRTEKYDLWEKVGKKSDARGNSTEFFPSMNQVVFTHYPMWPSPKMPNGEYMPKEDVPFENKHFKSFTDLKEYMKALRADDSTLKPDWIIVVYLLFKNEFNEREPAKMYLKYTQSAGAKYVGEKVVALLNDPLPGTLKKLDRVYRTPVHIQKTFSMKYGCYKMGDTSFVSYPTFEAVNATDRPSNDVLKWHLRDIMVDLTTKLKTKLSAPFLPA